MHNVASDSQDVIDVVNNVDSFTAPLKVPGPLRNARPSPPDSDHQEGSNSQGAMRDGPVPSGILESSPSLSPEATR